MSYKLQKPYTKKEYADFMIEYSQLKDLLTVDTIDAIYALEKDEIMQDGVPVKNPNYAQELAQKEKEKRKEAIKSELSALDAEAVRPLRAKVTGNAVDDDDRILNEIEGKVKALRAKYKLL